MRRSMTIATILTATVVFCAPETLGGVGNGLITLVEAGKFSPMAETIVIEKPVATAKSSELADGDGSALGKRVEVHHSGESRIEVQGCRIQSYRS